MKTTLSPCSPAPGPMSSNISERYCDEDHPIAVLARTGTYVIEHFRKVL